MNYGGNMPDWHQFNASHTSEVTSSSQNVNSGHLTFIPGVSPSSLNGINLNPEGFDKHQSEANFNLRHYQSLNNVSNGSKISTNAPLASMVQMQNCIGHYGSPNTRNPMIDNLNSPVNHRSTSIGTVNSDLGYRSNQVSFNNGPISHLSGPNCNINAPAGLGPGPVLRPGPGPGPGSGPGPGLGPGSGSGSVPGPISGSVPGAVIVPRSGSGPGPSSSSGSGFVPGHRQGTMPGPVQGTMGLQNVSVGSVHSGRPGPQSFIPCKGLCCNPDPNTNYQQWEKYGPYQANTLYKDNVHSSGYQIDNRHFGNNCNFRKDNFENKETLGPILSNTSNTDNRRSFIDYKYHKDHLVSRNYSASSGMTHNYPVQSYNYTGDYQKYPYSVKEHPKTNNMNISNPGAIKHVEQNFVAQQKYNSKQFQYQNGNLMPKGVSTLNVTPNVSSTQNSYFNSQFARNVPTEVSHECQENTDNATMVNTMQRSAFVHGSPSRYQVYQQKIAMQRFSVENHLRELSRIPGYQSHPKYKECFLRYREILKLQQSTEYQNQVQQTTRIPTPTNSTVQPINLQFDQNGMLINSNFLSNTFAKLQHAPSTEQRMENVGKQTEDQGPIISKGKHQEIQDQEQLTNQSQHQHASSSNTEDFQKQNQFSLEKCCNENHLKVPLDRSHNTDCITTDTGNQTMTQQKSSKEFANKPDLDVRQFLANWDDTDDEEGTDCNLPDAVSMEPTPVVVVSYENINSSAKTIQDTDITKQNIFHSNEAFNNQKKDDRDIIPAQDCLTVSYSSPENTENIKSSEQTIAEGVVKPGSIIHCISNGPDEIPTIHIVDNLEISSILGTSNDQIVDSLENQKTISFFKERTDPETELITLESTEHHEKNCTTKLCTEYNTALKNAVKEKDVDNSSISNTATISINSPELRILSISAKNNLDSTENLNLKKQNNYTSEELHNSDDISLPDLPTSECTPLSTTLNTPIHSDTEESSENIEDLAISTNPIEIMQNSPIISFTQSPVRMEPYEELNNDNHIKNSSISTLELKFQEGSHYKNNDTNDDHKRDITLGNFNFSTNSLRSESTTIMRNKQSKNLENNAVKNKTYVIDSKESDTNISDMSPALTSIEYEVETISTNLQTKELEHDKRSSRECDDINESLKSMQKSYPENVKKITVSAEAAPSPLQKNNSVEDIKNDLQLVSTVSQMSMDKNIAPKNLQGEVHHTSMSEGISVQTSKNRKEQYKARKERNVNTDTSISIPTQSEINLDVGNKAQENIPWENRFLREHADKERRITVEKQCIDHLKQSEHSNNKKFVKSDSSSFQCIEHCACHINHNKNCPVTVINDNAILSTKEIPDTTGKDTAQQNRQSQDLYCEKLSEPELQTNNTKDVYKGTEIKKNVSIKPAPLNIDAHSINIRNSESLQRDLKNTSTNIQFTKKEVSVLKDFRTQNNELQYVVKKQGENQHEKKKCKDSVDKKERVSTRTKGKNSLERKTDESLHHKNENTECQLRQENESLVAHKLCLEEKLSSSVNIHSHIFDATKKEKRHLLSEGFVKNANSDFGIKVANVNLQIKDSEIRKELILGDTSQEHIKDSLDGIKIEINVSCTERNSRGLDDNKMLLDENFRNIKDVNDQSAYETCARSLSDCKCHLYVKEHGIGHTLTFDKTHEMNEKFSTVKVTPNEEKKTKDNSFGIKQDERDSINNKNNENDLLQPSEDISIHTTAEKPVFNKPSNTIDIIPKDKLKEFQMHERNAQSDTDVIEDMKHLLNDLNMTRTLCVVANSAVTDVPNNISGETKNSIGNSDCTRASNIEMPDSTNCIDTLSNLQSIAESVDTNRNNKGEVAAVSFLPKHVEKPANDSMVNLGTKPTSSLGNMDFNFEKIDYQKCLNMDMGFNRLRVAVDENVQINTNFTGKWKKPKMMDHTLESTSGYINPIFLSIDKLENLHTVPVYTTKDGKISYSPNRRFTYHELMMEARKREGCSTAQNSHYADSLNHSSSFRKLYKRKRHHVGEDRKRHMEFKSTDHSYEQRRNYLNESCSRNSNKYKNHAHNMTNCNISFKRGSVDANNERSSSDTDEDVIRYNRNHSFATSNCNETYGNNENKCTNIAKSCGSTVTADDSNLRIVNQEAEKSPNVLHCDIRNLGMKETELIPSCSSQQDKGSMHSKNTETHVYNNVHDLHEKADFPCTSLSEYNKKIEDDESCIKACVYEKESSMLCIPYSNFEKSNVNKSNSTREETHDTSNKDKIDGNNVPYRFEELPSIENQSLILNVHIKNYVTDKSSENKKTKEETHDTSNEDKIDGNNVPYRFEELPSIENQSLISNVHIKTYVTDKSSENKKNHDPYTTNIENSKEMYISKELMLVQTTTEEKLGVQMSYNDSNSTGQGNFKAAENTSCKQVPMDTEIADPVEDKTSKSDNNIDITHDISQASSKSHSSKTVFLDKKDVSDNRDADNQEPPKLTKESLEFETANANELSENVDFIAQHPISIKQSIQEIGEEIKIVSDSSVKHENVHNSVKSTCAASDNIIAVTKKEFQAKSLYKENKHQHNEIRSVVVKSVDNAQISNNINQVHGKVTEKGVAQLACMDFSKDTIMTHDNSCNKELESQHNEITEVDTVDSPDVVQSSTQHSKSYNCSEDLNKNCLDNPSIVFDEEKLPVLSMHYSLNPNSNDNVESTEVIADENEQAKEQNYLSSLHISENTASTKSESTTNTKVVPKLVIKKTESLDSKLECSLDYTHSGDIASQQDIKLISTLHPKIPKMIITKNKSRSSTPSVESPEKKNVRKIESPLHENIKTITTMNGESSNSEVQVLKFNKHEGKIPKVKIKLEDISPKELKLCLKRKNIKKMIPKMKIKRIKTQSLNIDKNAAQSPMKNYTSLENTSKLDDTPTDFDDESDYNDDDDDNEDDADDDADDDDGDEDSDDNHTDGDSVSDHNTYLQTSLASSEEKSNKVPKFKVKKQELLFPELLKKRNAGIAKTPLKKIKKTEEKDASQSVHENVIQINDCQIKKDSFHCISEKIPKVIIKRSQVGAEFKCEISKSKRTSDIENAKWQPKVKLQRLRVLDHMVKDLKQSKITLTHTSLIDTIFMNNTLKCIKSCINQGHEHSKCKNKLSRSSSTSDLPTLKYKQRRLSDYDYTKAGDLKTFENDIHTNDKLSASSSTKKSKDVNNIPETCSTSIKHSNLNQSTEMALLTDPIACKINTRENKNKCSNLNRGKKRSSSRTVRYVHDDSDDEVKSLEGDVNNSGVNSAISEKRNAITVTKEYFSSDGNESESTIEDRFLKSNVGHSHSFDDNDNFVIKVDSSDESETTIEILPASPDISQCVIDDHDFENCKSQESYTEDAIPTQLELELELMNNHETQSSTVMSKTDDQKSNDSHYVHIETKYIDQGPRKLYFSEYQRSSHSTFKEDKYISRHNNHPQCDFNSDKTTAKEMIEAIPSSIKSIHSEKKTELSNEYIYCNDLLIKEVLAAKETLKKCFIRPGDGNKSRHKTVAEKKQGLSFNFKDLTKTLCESENGHRSNEESTKIHRKFKYLGGKKCKTARKMNLEKGETGHYKHGKQFSIGKKVKSQNTQDKKSYTMQCSTASTCTYVSVQESTTISLKASKQVDQITTNEELTISTPVARNKVSSENGHAQSTGKFYKNKSEDEDTHTEAIQNLNSKDQAHNINSNAGKGKEDNMPLLVPEVTLNFEPRSDRDSSRSPPVITSQIDTDNLMEDLKDTECKVITSVDKIKEDNKQSYEDCEMTIANIIAQLAYSEKATIKHRRYCNLCERWFPTMSRHRRHLAGYQHRYIELTQRKSIHALFILFTGKPCPRLLPANIVRNDCSIGELTPLQIAVQDIAKCVEDTQQNMETKI